MTAPTLIQRSRSWSTPRYIAVLAGLSALTFALGIVALEFLPGDGGAALWWPATGVGALVYMLYRGPRWQVFLLVSAVGMLSNIAVGRPLSFAVVGAVILVVELVVLVAVLRPQSTGAVLSSMRGLGRFFLAVLAASITIGIEGAVTLFLLAGIDPLVSFITLVPSHASALLLIVPLALMPLPRRGARVAAPRQVEGVLQFAITIVVAVILFSPALPVPMLFTLFPLFAWAATRFSPVFVVTELLAVAVITPTLAVANGGPFGYAQGIESPGWIVQVFMISAAITTLFLTVVRAERESLAEEKERQAAIMRGGFLGSQVGFLVVRRSRENAFEVLEANVTAADIVDHGRLQGLLDGWLGDPRSDLDREVAGADGRSWRIFGSRMPGDRDEVVAGIQLVDISDHVAARDAMTHAIAREHAVANELRELGRQKDDFVSAVSHELRTPITSILGFAEDLDETASPEEQVMTEVIVRNSRRLAGMVEQLLELGRMTSPNPVRAMGVVPLNRIVLETAEEQGRAAHAVGVTIETHLHEPGPGVTGDEASVGRVVTNLLSNAIKFTPSGGFIRLTTSFDGEQATLVIDDSGVGISLHDRERVFERFFRSSDDAKLAAPGTGLGLSIVRSLVELQGGSIEIDDSPLGGTRVIVALTAAEIRAESDAAEAATAAAAAAAAL